MIQKDINSSHFCVFHLKSIRGLFMLSQIIFDPLLPQEQAGFRLEDLLKIKLSSSSKKLQRGSLARKKAGAMLFDLTAADVTLYGTAVLLAKLFALDQSIRNLILTIMLHWPQKLITKFKKRCLLRISNATSPP